MSSPEVSQQQQPVSMLMSTPNHDTLSKPRTLPLQTDMLDDNNNHSPESRPVDLHSPIIEEDDEDETGSEAINEPLTPTDFPSSSQNVAPHQLDGSHLPFSRTNGKLPALLKTAATPPSSAGGSTNMEAVNAEQTSATNAQAAPASSPTKDSAPGIKRAISNLFRRSNSNQAVPVPIQATPQPISAKPIFNSNFNEQNQSTPDELYLSSPPRRSFLSGQRRMSTNATPQAYTPATTRSNSPPSPGHADTPNRSESLLGEPQPGDFFGHKKQKSHTGFARITFRARERPAAPPRHRSGSTDIPRNSIPVSDQEIPDPELGRALPWAFPAASGTGLKARRLSLSLPDDFTVDVGDLHSELDDESRIVSRRGERLGKGATSEVRKMTRKGVRTELYAVKEFRGKSSRETAEEYEKKVKSEYSISKSLHHPNIVETFRLCTDRGRWNHVMEYCDGGDLFKLLASGYLKGEARMTDKLCLFKQLLQGVYYLHSNGIAHRDIKLENLLLTNKCKLKITDFGVSEVFSGIHPGLRAAGGQCGRGMGDVRLSDPGVCGSAPYIAPEVLPAKEPYDPRPLDVWSSAIVMVHLIFGGAIWNKAELGQGNTHYENLVRGWDKWNAKHSPEDETTDTDYPHFSAFDKCVNPPALRRMLINMLNPDPKKRTTIANVAQNRWMKNIECCQLDSYDDPTTFIDATKSCTHVKTTKVVQHVHVPPSKAATMRDKVAKNLSVRNPRDT